MVANNLSLKIS